MTDGGSTIDQSTCVMSLRFGTPGHRTSASLHGPGSTSLVQATRAAGSSAIRTAISSPPYPEKRLPIVVILRPRLDPTSCNNGSRTRAHLAGSRSPRAHLRGKADRACTSKPDPSPTDSGLRTTLQTCPLATVRSTRDTERQPQLPTRQQARRPPQAHAPTGRLGKGSRTGSPCPRTSCARAYASRERGGAGS